MALASKTWDETPPVTNSLRLVGSDKCTSAKPETLFIANTVNGPPPSPAQSPIIPMTLVKPPGRLNKLSVISDLDRLKGLSSDWNGYGAQPIDWALIEQAKRFIEKLPGDIVVTPSVVPMTRGRLQFEWHRGDRSLELEFESMGRIRYLKADDDSGIDEEAILLTDQTPELEELLRWFSSE